MRSILNERYMIRAAPLRLSCLPYERLEKMPLAEHHLFPLPADHIHSSPVGLLG